MKKLILLVLTVIALGSFVPMAEAASPSHASTSAAKHHKKHPVKHKKHHHTVKKKK